MLVQHPMKILQRFARREVHGLVAQPNQAGLHLGGERAAHRQILTHGFLDAGFLVRPAAIDPLAGGALEVLELPSPVLGLPPTGQRVTAPTKLLHQIHALTARVPEQVQVGGEMHLGLQHITVHFDLKRRAGRAGFFCEHLASGGGNARIDLLQQFVIEQRDVVPQRLMTKPFVFLAPGCGRHAQHLAHQRIIVGNVFQPIPVGIQSQTHDPVWSNNSSVKFQCCHSGFVLDSCAVNLSPCLGKSCWLVSPVKSMRPCAKNWSSFWKKTMCIARSWNGIHLTGGCRMLSARFSPKRANPSVSCWRTSSPWSNPKPCSNGIANWSPSNGTFPAAGTPNQVGRPSQLRLNNWWCNSPAKTQAGVMTASSAPWLTRGITFPIRRWAIFYNDRGWARHPNANATPPGPRSSAGTRPCSGPPTSSPLKSGPPPA